MNVSKKALSLLLSITLVASTAVSTGAFAATDSKIPVSNISASGESESGLQAAKEALNTELEKTSGYQQNDYTSNSWSKLASAVENGNSVKDGTDITKIKAASEAIESAIGSLVKTSDLAAAKEALKSQIDAANTYHDNNNKAYDADSWTNFTAALETATGSSLSSSTDLKEVVGATAGLHAAIEKLNESAAAVSNLKNAIEKFSALVTGKNSDNLYEPGSWTIFATAYEAAVGQKKNPEKLYMVQDATDKLNETFRNLAMTLQKEEDTINGIKGIPDSPNAGDAPTIKSLAAQAEHFSASDKKKLTPELVKKLEDALATVLSVSKPSPTLDVSGISSSDQMTGDPVVFGLLLASGYTGTGTAPTLGLNITQDVSATPSNQIIFDADFTVDGKTVHDLLVPVTVTIHLPKAFVYNPSYTYTIHHVKAGGSTEELTPTFDTTNHTMTFTTNSFSDFTLTGTAPTHTGGSSGSGSTVSPITAPSSPTATFVSDTTANFGVSGAYTFKITSENGKAPVFVVGTPGVFDVQLVKQVGKDYYYKITAAGAPGAQAGIYINGGSRLLIATVKTNPTYVKSDTTAPFKVKAGKSYVFKLTANAKPFFVAGTKSAFQVTFVKQGGKDYFFQVTAVGKAGQSCGFYINSHNAPVAVATVA